MIEIFGYFLGIGMLAWGLSEQIGWKSAFCVSIGLGLLLLIAGI